MKNNPTTHVNRAEKPSRTSALLKRTSVTLIRMAKWFEKYEIDIFLWLSLVGGSIIFVMAMRAIS